MELANGGAVCYSPSRLGKLVLRVTGYPAKINERRYRQTRENHKENNNTTITTAATIVKLETSVPNVKVQEEDNNNLEIQELEEATEEGKCHDKETVSSHKRETRHLYLGFHHPWDRDLWRKWLKQVSLFFIYFFFFILSLYYM